MAVLTSILTPQLIKYIDRARVARDLDNINAVDRVLRLAVIDPPATIALSNGNLHYRPCGCIRGISGFLAGELTDAFGPSKPKCADSGHTSALYVMPELTSKFYKSKDYFLTGDNNNWASNMVTTWKFFKGPAGTLDMKWFHTWDPYTGNPEYKSGILQP